MTSNAALQTRREAAVARGVATMLPVFAARARGAELWDIEGKRYIDFAGGIARAQHRAQSSARGGGGGGAARRLHP